MWSTGYGWRDGSSGGKDVYARVYKYINDILVLCVRVCMHASSLQESKSFQSLGTCAVHVWSPT